MREIAVVAEACERLIFHRIGLGRIEGAVPVRVMLLDDEGAEKLVERPAVPKPDHAPPLEQEGRDAGDPDMGMGTRSARRHDQHRQPGARGSDQQSDAASHHGSGFQHRACRQA
jgi:hypothetical protein